MQIVKPWIEYWGQCPTDLPGNLGLIEQAGRLCYKSEGKAGPGTAAPFVEKLIRSGHGAMVEHSNLVLVEFDGGAGESLYEAAEDTFLTRFESGGTYYVGGNLRAWLEVLGEKSIKGLYEKINEGWYFGWQICPHDEIPDPLHRYTVKLICDRGVSHEMVRHRPCSFAQESTRYCDYTGDVVFVEPYWYPGAPQYVRDQFHDALQTTESVYTFLRENNCTPQAARAVLPSATKTELVVTADQAEWAIIQTLRNHRAAHPDMQRLMAMIPWHQLLPAECWQEAE